MPGQLLPQRIREFDFRILLLRCCKLDNANLRLLKLELLNAKIEKPKKDHIQSPA